MHTLPATELAECIRFDPLLPKGSASNQPGSTKIAGRVLLDVLASPGFAFVDAMQSGVLIGLIKSALVSGVASISRPEAIRQAHLLSRSTREQAEGILEMLHSAELIFADEVSVSIPALTAALTAQDAEKARRSQGWARRRAGEGSVTFGEAQDPAIENSQPVGVAVEAAITVSVVESCGATVPSEDLSISEDDLMGAAEGLLGSTQGSLLPEEDERTDGAPLVYLLEIEGGEAVESEVVAEIVAKGGHVVQITKGYIAWLQSMCSRVDALSQVRKAAGWCAANKSRRKTVNGMGKFLVSWLNRADSSAEKFQAGRSGASAFGTGSATANAVPAKGADSDDIDDLNELIALRAPTLQNAAADQGVPA